MIKHYCDKCNKFIYKEDAYKITLYNTYEFCKECYKEIEEFIFKKEVENDV